MAKQTETQTKTASGPMSNRFVYIVESPSDVDMLDGRAEGRLLTEALSLTGIKSVYKMAVSKETFVRSLRGELVDAVKEMNGSPILQKGVTPLRTVRKRAPEDGPGRDWAGHKAWFFPDMRS